MLPEKLWLFKRIDSQYFRFVPSSKNFKKIEEEYMNLNANYLVKNNSQQHFS